MPGLPATSPKSRWQRGGIWVVWRRSGGDFGRYWALGLAACGPTAQPLTPLPADQYPVWARTLALVEHCYATGRLSAEDTVGLRQQTRANLAQYQYDAATLNRMMQTSLAMGPQIEADPSGKRVVAQNCAEMARTAATNRVTDQQNAAAQLQRAQLAAAAAQRQAALAPVYAPQPYAPTPMPQFQMPQVQPIQYGNRNNVVFCNRLGSYVVTCR
jgi:hypothetical protein